MFNLLQDIRLAVGAVNIDIPGLLINKRSSTLQTELFPRIHKTYYGSAMVRRFNVKISRIKPSTDI